VPTERLWSVRWQDPNPGDPMTRILEVCPPSPGACEYVKYEREILDADGNATRMGFVHFGGSVRATLNTSEEQSPESNEMVLTKSVIFEAPEPAHATMLVSGLVLLALLARARR